MAQTGLQIQVGWQPSAALPRLLSGNGAGASRTHLDLSVSRAHCSLRRRTVRLQQSRGDIQFMKFRIFDGKVSKCRKNSGGIGCYVAPRGTLEELSTAEVGGKQSSKDLNVEAIRGREGSSFNWLAQWYPVGVIKHLDEKQPHPVTILGRELVMWWDRSGSQWQVFADVCPHRLAPLSEGRINEQGHLQCSYHGWSFAPSSGACTLIPQATEKVFERRNLKRSCATVYPSKEQQGLLWVYMDNSVGAEELAGSSPPFLPVLSDPDYVYDLVMTDVSYSYESLIENLLDPAHVPFAHHAIQGRRENAKPLNLQVEGFQSAGFRGSNGAEQSYKFVAPYLSTMTFTLPPASPPKGHPWALKFREFIKSKVIGSESSTRKISTVFFCIPVLPGKSKVVYAFPRNFAKAVAKWTPKWLSHQVHMTVIDSDMMLLHLMERRLEDRGGMQNIGKLYYTPTASDAFVDAYRKWLKVYGGGKPDFGPKSADRLSPSAPRRVVLDRYSLHVANCTYCSGALRNFKLIESGLVALPFLLIGLVAASNSRPLRAINGLSIPLVVIAFISFLSSRWLKKWITKNYEFHDYNHALVK